MPLSEHEQKLLLQMEQQLRQEDPKLADNLASTEQKAAAARDPRRLVLGVLGVAVGLGLLLSGVYFQQIWLGIVAFIVMCACGWVAAGGDSATTAASPAGKGGGRPRAAAPGAGPGKSSFMQNLEDRWDRRQQDGS